MNHLLFKNDRSVLTFKIFFPIGKKLLYLLRSIKWTFIAGKKDKNFQG